METFVVLTKETAYTMASTAVMILLVVFLITGFPRIGLVVTLAVILTNYFLLALIPVVGLHFNDVVVGYLISSIGLSVLYSA